MQSYRRTVLLVFFCSLLLLCLY